MYILYFEIYGKRFEILEVFKAAVFSEFFE